MSPRQLARLALVLGALLLLWGAAALARRRESAAPAGDRFTLPRISRTDVDTVRIARKGDTTLLIRRDSSDWRVNGHPASSTVVADFFAALADTAEPAELVAQQPASQEGLGVDSATGTHVTIEGRGKRLLDLFAGHQTPDLEGGYIRPAGEPATWLLRGRLAELAGRGTDEWRDRHVAGVPIDSVQALEITRGKKSYAIRKSDKGWRLEPAGLAPDSSAMASLLAAYREVQAEGFASPAQADSARFGRPDRSARLLRRNGSPLLALAFDSTASGFWVKADTPGTVFRMESWSADRLTPADSTLRPAHH
jgi:hypothetical protein